MSGLRVIVELTERELLAHPATLLAEVESIRYTGWGVAVDDIGAHPHWVECPCGRPYTGPQPHYIGGWQPMPASWTDEWAKWPHLTRIVEYVDVPELATA